MIHVKFLDIFDMLIIMLVCIHVCNILFMMGEKLFSEDEYSALLKYLPPLTARPGDGLSTPMEIKNSLNLCLFQAWEMLMMNS